MRYIDLTHTINSKIPVYPGDSLIKIVQTGNYKKDGFKTSQLTINMHAGTHIDAPAHMISGGKNVSEVGIERLVGRGILIDARGLKRIDQSVLKGKRIKKGDIVLLLTGFGKKIKSSSYFTNYPEVTENFARELVWSGIKMFGSDTASPDYAPFKIHKLLLSKGILIIENLTNLEKLVGVKNFEIIALPAKFALDGAPARVIAKIN